MAHLTAPNLRGRGISKTKFTKGGQPKRSGNWSALTIHAQSLQSKDYVVWERVDPETGIKILIVGNETPLSYLMGELVMTLAMNDPHFDFYRREGIKTVGGKAHSANMTLRKAKGSPQWRMGRWGMYREEIYTDGDFVYPFPEY